jgi:tetratricopeptide (TPR) repeat protein
MRAYDQRVRIMNTSRALSTICVGILLVLAVVPGGFSQVTEQVDPFYTKQLEDGKFLYQGGKFAEAAQCFEIAAFGFLDAPARLLESYLYLEACHFQTKNVDKAKYYADEMKRLKLEDQIASLNLSPALINKHREIAAYFNRLEAKAPAAAVSTSSSALGVADEIAKLKNLLRANQANADAALKLSAIYLEQKNLKAAKSTLQDLLAFNPKNPLANFELGKILASERKYAEALAAFDKAAPSLPNDIELFYQIGTAAAALKNYEKAGWAFGRANQLGPSYKDTAKFLAQIEAVEKSKIRESQNVLAKARNEFNLDKKISFYRQALDLDPSNVEIYFEVKAAYLSKNRYKDAIGWLEPLLKAYPDNVRIYKELGDLYVRDKAYDKAVKVLKDGLKLDPKDPEVDYLLAKAYIGQKKYREAADELEIVMAKSPYYKDSRDLYKQCLDNMKKK